MDYLTVRAELRFIATHIERGRLLMYANAFATGFNVLAFVGSGWGTFAACACFHTSMTVFLARRLQWELWYAYHLRVDVRMWETLFTQAAGGRPQ